MTIRTPLAQVEGLGAAHSGTDHFAKQRGTAVALVVLSAWFLYSAFSLIGADRATAAAYLAEPINAVAIALFIITALMHMTIGMQVVIEDYVTGEKAKVALLLLNRFFAWSVGVAALFALLKISLAQTLH